MRIEDDELRDLFREESSEHLSRLEQGLLELEADPRDERTLEEVYRAAHSLKGAGASRLSCRCSVKWPPPHSTPTRR